jgi:hypothetical protein
MTRRVLFLVFAASSLLATLFSLVASTIVSAHIRPQVLLVGSFHGKAGQFSSIQAAVNAARPGDWILIGPGDYHEQGSNVAGVLVATPDIHIRGMDRNRVIVDGTNAKPGARPCSSDPAVQNFGPGGAGRNGIEVLKVNGVSVENLTACNFLSDASGNNGNQIWFNGGVSSGMIGMGAFRATYLTASSTYFKDEVSPQAQYGIYANNGKGPGLIDQSYASNMSAAAYYVGACPDCNIVLTHAHAQNSAIGFLGTNAGGHLIIENSEWDHNKGGIAPLSANNDDWPTPQNGACPNEGKGPLGSHSCTIIRNNFVHDNNNPNTPLFILRLSAALFPIGTGIQIAGGQNDTVIHNRVTRNGSWGIVIYDVPDSETPPPTNPNPCRGGIQQDPICYFTAFGNEVANNVLKDNGFFGNVTNSDLADGHVFHNPGNCWHGNVDPNGITSTPADIQRVLGACGVANQGDPLVLTLVECMATGSPQFCDAVGPVHVPTRTTAILLPIPTQPSMANPCAGVPSNVWCNHGHHGQSIDAADMMPSGHDITRNQLLYDQPIALRSTN